MVNPLERDKVVVTNSKEERYHPQSQNMELAGHFREEVLVLAFYLKCLGYAAFLKDSDVSTAPISFNVLEEKVEARFHKCHLYDKMELFLVILGTSCFCRALLTFH